MLLVALAAACGTSAARAPATLTPVPAARAEVIRFEIGSDPDAAEVPRYLAAQALEGQGYRIETPSFADTSLTLVALDQGDVDFAVVSNLNGVAAIAEGSPLALILDESRNTGVVVAAAGIQDCAGLAGLPFGTNALTGSRITMWYQYLERECPDIEPKYLVISGSSSRAAAMLSGELDAALLDLFDYYELDRERPGAFHILVDFSRVFPALTSVSLFTRRDLAEEYPTTVKDVIRATLEARRRVQDVDILTNEIVKNLELDAEAARPLAETYLAEEIWDVNGRYTLDLVQENIDFLVAAGGLETSLTADRVADLSYLNAVLDEIGRE
jgi:ABC-type nitrate/sulfonate/bicarbonate transport system substrate-binding protein